MQEKNSRLKTPVNFQSPFWKNKTILIDSRNLLFPEKSIFLALKGRFTDGHDFIVSLYEQGVRCFVISKAIDTGSYPEADFLWVEDVVSLLQEYAKHHRKQFDFPVIGITGSNGKTILKEWLYLLLQKDFSLVKSPKSYNSQIGVPLSVLHMNERHKLGIFEAGISLPGEMQKLQSVLLPDIGIFTNIGKAHASGFESESQKIREKLQLFRACKILIYKYDHQLIHQEIVSEGISNCFSWGADTKADLPVFYKIKKQHTLLNIQYKEKVHKVKIPFRNAAAIENCMLAIATMLYLGTDIKSLEKRIKNLRDVPMRLELKEGINNCQIIDDSYNNDLQGLQIALDFLNQKQVKRGGKTLILSDVPEAKDKEQYQEIAELLQEHQISRFIGIGPALTKYKSLFDGLAKSSFFENTSDFTAAIGQSVFFERDSILLKGARSFGFEKIAQQLKKRIHGSMLEISLTALKNNLQVYKNCLRNDTKIMVMVKASAYGSGSREIAQLLQYNHVDYLGVAYVDEGVKLRQEGIYLPIMVMNTAAHEFEILYQHELQPALFSFSLLEKFIIFLRSKKPQNPYPVHIEIDSGMHRLGFQEKEVDNLISRLKQSKKLIRTAGIFSHLAASDEALHDSFSLLQAEMFMRQADKIEKALACKSIKHLLNSSGISRLSQYQFDMVRLGIGLYGYDAKKTLIKLENVLQFKTCISQIKHLKSGDTIGYSRMAKVEKDSTIAVLAIGYADGFLRIFGNGNSSVLIRGKRAVTIGNICMDMCFVDISHIEDAEEGDEVVIFDSMNEIVKLSEVAQTIPYEILTNISERVPRIFYED